MQVNSLVPDDPNPEFWAGPTPNDRAIGNGVGMLWQATITTPQTPQFGYGSLELVQLVTPQDSYTTKTAPVQIHNDPLNGIMGMDGPYPYGGHIYKETLPAQNTSYVDGDSPGLHLVTQQGIVVASATFQSSFLDYFMYFAPGPDTQWVCVGVYSWKADGNVALPASGHWFDYTAPTNAPYPDWGGSITPSGMTQFTNGAIGPNVFPEWTNLDISHPY